MQLGFSKARGGYTTWSGFVMYVSLVRGMRKQLFMYYYYEYDPPNL